MRIAELRIGVVEAPLRRPFKTALRTTATIRSVVLALRWESGRASGVAWGSAAATPAITGDTEEAILTDLARAAAVLRGAEAHSPGGGAEQLPARLPEQFLDLLPDGAVTTASALAALDIALHDAAAQAAGVPLLALLRGTGEAHATAYRVTDTTISVDTPAVMAQEAAESVARGFDVLKVKVGDQPEFDLERLRAVRGAAPAARLLVDANQSWDADEAVRILRVIEDAGIGIELVEQPVARHDLDGLARVRGAVDTPILADEAVFTAADARRLLERGAADMINVKLLKSGGLRGAREILDLAHEAGMACMVGAMMESTIGISAALALAGSHPAVSLVDLDPPLLTAKDPVRGALRAEGATLHTLAAPGLGIDDVEDVTWID